MAQNTLKRSPDSVLPASVVDRSYTPATVTDKISEIVLTTKTPTGWIIGFLIAFSGLMLLNLAITVIFAKGVGVWGINVPVAWGFAIVNFVWWIGIGHAGTLISAVLLLFRQEWRTSINRSAEAMTLFAVACAGLFPLLHMGRPWYFYWLLPYPNTMLLWPQWRSPLVWDCFAVSTYATVSLLFWYVGLIPDLATLRDRSKHPVGRVIYGAMSMGWRGGAMHWHRYEVAYLLLAGIATPLVVSVHSVVSMDFTGGIVPGWHTTFFPPYFVAGAIFSGFAMVMTLAIPLRYAYGLEGLITMRHLENMAKVMLVTGLMVSYGYGCEVFFGWYSDDKAEWFVSLSRMTGPYKPIYWLLIFCNFLTPQFFWFKAFRRNILWLFIASIIVNVGMWAERFVIIVTSLNREFMPSMWGMYYPTIWDWCTYIGTLGFFMTLMFLFIRSLPMIAVAEMRQLVAEPAGGHAHAHGKEAEHH
ncbi:MAG: NrfD/PsrC family molybdoenzyme membrane anchor subunit [Tepidisphaeraceae bacterium]|jgi:molybdopterin-containing oxidoreductase family membrane subunit